MSHGTWEYASGRDLNFAYRAFTFYGRPFQTFWLSKSFVTPREDGSPLKTYPATPNGQHLPALTHIWFRLIPFRSPLLRESHLISFPPPTEMFQFSRYGSLPS